MVRILVVDDQDDIRLIMRTLLEAEGWRVDEAASGEEGLERVREEPPDIVVTDNQMPGLSGIEMARRLRGDGFTRPIIGFPAALTLELRSQAEELAIVTVSKPDFRGLVDTIRSLSQG